MSAEQTTQTAAEAAQAAGNSARPINVGVHRGKPRLWLEGFWLEAAGFVRGRRYRLTFEAGQIVLTIAADGDRVVSGKAKGDRHVPIVDVNAKTLWFSGKAIAYLSPGRILIMPSIARQEGE